MSRRTSTHEEFTLKEKLTYGIIGVALLGGSFFIGRNLIRKARAVSEEKKTYDETSAASYAQKLKMAFENDIWFGWGTDEDSVRTVIRAIPDREEFKKVMASYQKLFSRSLMLDLKNELTTTEYNEMLSIISGKPERVGISQVTEIGQQQYLSWAKRLRAAFDMMYAFIPGTDEPAIKAVFMEIPTQADFKKLALVYKNEYRNDLINDLKAELEFWEFGSYMAIINNKPNENQK